MTRKELNLAIFEGTADRVLWQPRLETWISHHRSAETLPDRFRAMSDLEIYDQLGCSIRYGGRCAIETYEDREDVVRTEQRYGDHRIETVRTPAGEITTVHHEVWQAGRCVNSRIAEYPVKTVDDLRVATDLVNRQRFRVNREVFAAAARAVGHRSELTMFLSSAGFTDLVKWWCGLVETHYLLADHPVEVEAFLQACDRCDDRMLDEALKLPCRIFNLGDHATNEFTPPPILKKYMLPRWQRISKRLHAENRFVHSHWDGNSVLMLPFIRETGLDAIEALTPAPMGDMTIEQIKEAVGDTTIVLDLLPTIDFLPDSRTEDLLDFARRVIDMFAPKLILGVSDEISAAGQIEKIEAVSELVDKICGLAD